MKKAKTSATQRRKSGSGLVNLTIPVSWINIRRPKAAGAKKSKKPPTPVPTPTPTPAPTKVAKTKKEWAEIATLALLLVAIATIMLPWLWNNQEKKLTTTPPPATAINDHPEATNLKVTSAEAEATKGKAAMQATEGQLADVTARLGQSEARTALADAKAKASEETVKKQLSETAKELKVANLKVASAEAKATRVKATEANTKLQPLPPVQTVITKFVTTPPLVAVVAMTPAVVTNHTPVISPQTGLPVFNNKNEVIVNVTATPLPPHQLEPQPYWLRKLW